MERKKTSIKFNEQLWKDLKKHCIDNDAELSTYLEDLVRSDLRKRKGRKKP